MNKTPTITNYYQATTTSHHQPTTHNHRQPTNNHRQHRQETRTHKQQTTYNKQQWTPRTTTYLNSNAFLLFCYREHGRFGWCWTQHWCRQEAEGANSPLMVATWADVTHHSFPKGGRDAAWPPLRRQAIVLPADVLLLHMVELAGTVWSLSLCRRWWNTWWAREMKQNASRNLPRCAVSVTECGKRGDWAMQSCCCRRKQAKFGFFRATRTRLAAIFTSCKMLNTAYWSRVPAVKKLGYWILLIALMDSRGRRSWRWTFGPKSWPSSSWERLKRLRRWSGLGCRWWAADGVDNTYLYARRRTLFSCAHHSAQITRWSALFQCCNIGIGSRYKVSVSRFSQNHCHLFDMSLLGVLFVRFLLVASISYLFSVTNLQRRQHHWRAPLLTGVECMAAWPIRLQTLMDKFNLVPGIDHGGVGRGVAVPLQDQSKGRSTMVSTRNSCVLRKYVESTPDQVRESSHWCQ